MKEKILENLKEAYIVELLTLKDYLIVIACTIEPTQYLNEEICPK